MNSARFLVLLALALAASSAAASAHRSLLDTTCRGVRDQCLDKTRFCEAVSACQNIFLCLLPRYDRASAACMATDRGRT